MKTSNMKTIVLLAALVASQNVFAGAGKFDSAEFNAIINENVKAEQALRAQLRDRTGVPDLRKEMRRNFNETRRQIIGTMESENVAAPTTDNWETKRNEADKHLMRKNLKRVSQEIDLSQQE